MTSSASLSSSQHQEDTDPLGISSNTFDMFHPGHTTPMTTFPGIPTNVNTSAANSFIGNDLATLMALFSGGAGGFGGGSEMGMGMDGGGMKVVGEGNGMSGFEAVDGNSGIGGVSQQSFNESPGSAIISQERAHVLMSIDSESPSHQQHPAPPDLLDRMRHMIAEQMTQLLIEERIRELEAELRAVKADNASLRGTVDNLVQRMSEAGPQRTGRKRRGRKGRGLAASSESRLARNTAIEKVVREVMLRAVGVQYEGRNMKFVLPAPLEPGEPSRLGEDGAKLWNPPWLRGLKDEEVLVFLRFLVGLVLCNEESKDEENRIFTNLSSDERMAPFKRYFTTLAGRYKRQVDSAAAAQGDARSKAGTRGKRVDRLVEDIRALALANVAKKLSEAFGADKARGVADLINPSWMDPIHSDAGEARPDVWKTRKQEKGGGGQGTVAWEVRRRLWKSRKQRRLELLCIQELRQQRKAKGLQAQTFMFPGPSENHINSGPPMDDDSRPWVACVSPRWIRESSNQTLTFREVDPEHSVLTVDIPDEMFDDESKACLADDEDENEDD